MFNSAPGYYTITQNIIEVDKYYVLSFKSPRKPTLLRFSCKTKLLAQSYIMSRPHPEFFEVINGEDALNRNISISNKRLGISDGPQKYHYPANCKTWQKKKQHRTNYRDDIRRAFESINTIKQFTITYRSKTYSIFERTISDAFKQLNKFSGMSWDHFIKNVSNEPTKLAKGTLFIKSAKVNMVMIEAFNKKHHGTIFRHKPNYGTISALEQASIRAHSKKPKQLIIYGTSNDNNRGFGEIWRK